MTVFYVGLAIFSGLGLAAIVTFLVWWYGEKVQGPDIEED